jgi:hypothetical protein
LALPLKQDPQVESQELQQEAQELEQLADPKYLVGHSSKHVISCSYLDLQQIH